MGYFEELAIDSAQFWKKPSTKKDSENPGWYLGNQRFKLTDRTPLISTFRNCKVKTNKQLLKLYPTLAVNHKLQEYLIT